VNMKDQIGGNEILDLELKWVQSQLWSMMPASSLDICSQCDGLDDGCVPAYKRRR